MPAHPRRARGFPPPGASKTHIFLIIFSMHFPIDFLSLLARFCTPTCLQKSIKIHQKSMLRGNPSWAWSFVDFWLIFAANFDPITMKNHEKFICFNSFYKFGLSKMAWIFDPILVPTCLHFPSKNHQKCIKTETWKALFFWWFFAWISYRLSFDLGAQLGAVLAPQTRPRRLQNASKTAPKTKCATFFAPAVILIDFWLILGGFSNDFR